MNTRLDRISETYTQRCEEERGKLNSGELSQGQYHERLREHAEWMESRIRKLGNEVELHKIFLDDKENE